jgi:putative addiction module component (TIGR02574 family)
MMSSTLQRLGIDRMTIAERIALVQEILDSVASDQPRDTLSEAKRAEIDRRLVQHEADPTEGVPWSEIESAALARFRR